MTIGTRLHTFISGKLVGSDQHGNRYYTERRDPVGRRKRRWVLYDGEAEASKVPPEWHAWLHYTVDEPLQPLAGQRPWIKEHVPNRTGTPDAYLPPGHDLRGARRERTAADYEPWQP